MGTATASSPTAISPSRRWSMLALGLFAQTASAMFTYGAAFLIPALQHRGLNLSQAGVVVAMPVAGLTLTLIAWGWFIDRFGERLALALGSALVCAGGLTAAAMAGSTIAMTAALFVGGIGTGSTNGASGRLIVGWFPENRRGLAMGIRQGALPLGVAVGALTLPGLAAAHGLSGALLLPALLAGLAAIGSAVWVSDPPRPARKDAGALLDNPYRRPGIGGLLTRVHGVSALLVVPQLTMWTFSLVWLHHARGWSLAAAGVAVTVAQLLGAAGRIGAGLWSDRVGSRLRPLRTIAITAAATMAGLAVTDLLDWGVAAVLLMVTVSVVSVADNGLAYTVVAETAGPYWSGRALGIQNTAQNLTSTALPPVFGTLITAFGYPATFAVGAALAAVAACLVPRAEEPGTQQAQPIH